ncbi:hypothetical protein B0T09DRAFT_316238 [Sordaria sp. MPI-SDFR-AT-0083]|nr:hypothetical protein B0T09DRAFT_316238 [Sordaria sp. MPI-SDFR-AT-0083]
MHMDKAYILQLVKTLAKAQQALATEVGPETEDWEAKPEKVEQHPDALGLRDELAGENQMKASSSDQNYVCRRLTEIGRKECLGREHEEPPLEAGQGFHVHLFDGSHANASEAGHQGHHG